MQPLSLLVFLSVLSPAPLSPSRMRRSSLLAACISGFPAFAENDGKREVRKEHKEAVAYSLALLVLQA